MAETEQGKRWWCIVHRREATATDLHLDPVCDPKLDGILIPCDCVELDRKDG